MSIVIRKKAQRDPTTLFWSKVERIFGEIPQLLKLILEHNGFDTFLALKGIQWDDKNFFFQALEESVIGLTELDDRDKFKMRFKEELKENNQSMEKFKLKLGHKNLIINLCHELQKTNLEEFNSTPYTSVQIPEVNRLQTELIVRKQSDDEHHYSREEEQEHNEQKANQPPPSKRSKYDSCSSSNIEIQDVASPETNEQIQYIYETEEDDGSNQFLDQEYIDDDNEIVEYQEISAEDIDSGNGIYNAEQIVKTEADQFEQSECYEIANYQATRKKTEKNKKPLHMYTEEFLQMQMSLGRVVTPGRRRPKLQKQYKIDTDEGLLEKWSDLVRQSCEVIVPHDLLSRYDLSHIELTKTMPNIWEVRCPMCTKKLRLQLTQEGKYVNFKRSNFERHLRIVHFKSIQAFKQNDDSEHADLLEEVHTD